MRAMLAAVYRGDFVEVPMMGRPLRLLTLNVIETCDAACRYCHWWRVKTAPEPYEALAGAVDDAAMLGTAAVRLSGGEPLLRSDLPLLVSHIRRKGLVSM